MNAEAERALVQVADEIGVPRNWLYNLIRHESAWNPLAVNPIPYNKSKVDKGLESPKHARGLIQFIDSTAQGLGFRDSKDIIDRYPDAPGQLRNAVLPYLKRMKPYPTAQSLYMAVFYPPARSWPIYQDFPAFVQAVNPGIKKVSDYIARVDRSPVVKMLLILIVGAAAVAGAYYFTSKDRGGSLWQRKTETTQAQRETAPQLLIKRV